MENQLKIVRVKQIPIRVEIWLWYCQKIHQNSHWCAKFTPHWHFIELVRPFLFCIDNAIHIWLWHKKNTGEVTLRIEQKHFRDTQTHPHTMGINVILSKWPCHSTEKRSHCLLYSLIQMEWINFLELSNVCTLRYIVHVDFSNAV